MQLHENTVLSDKYKLIRQLGQGGFSEVWLADDIVARIQVAVKIYTPGRGLDDDGIDLFRHEFALLFDMSHSNLLKPANFDVHDRMPYLVMPYCRDGSVHRLIGKIDEETVWKILHDISSGLEYLHSLDPPVIHQDIKPDNVLAGADGRYFITDFGISTKVRSTLRRSIIDSQKSSGGTIAYMGPERFSKNSLPVKASDIWSLGATLFELLTGMLPFGEFGGTLQKTGADIPDVTGEWSGNLKKIVMKCLESEPWNRPTAEMLRKWAERHFNGKPVQFNDDKLFNLKKVAIAAACVIVVLACGFFLVSKYSEPNTGKECATLISKADMQISQGEEYYKEALSNYENALTIAPDDIIRQDIQTKKQNLSTRMDSLVSEYIRKADLFEDLGTENGRKQAANFLSKALKIEDNPQINKRLNSLNAQN